jgi:hypothetical protein
MKKKLITALLLICISIGSIAQPASAKWKIYENKKYSFSIRYPNGFKNTDRERFKSIFSIALEDKKFFEKTNLSEVTINIGIKDGVSDVKKAIAYWNPIYFSSDETDTAGLKAVRINNIVFYKKNSGDAGAGQRYSSTGYFTIHKNICYSIMLFIHSGNIEMYEEGTKNFDEKKIDNLFMQVLKTFSFK